MTLEIRPITDDEVPAYRDAVMTTFGDDHHADPDGAERLRALIPHPSAQCWAAFDGATIVATAATLDHAIIIPGGGSVAMAGLTMAVVRPTHRRRGLLREMMRLHLEDARGRGFPISGLWSSEGSIYGRFGYGVAAEADAIEIADAPAIRFSEARELDSLEWVDEGGARQRLPEVYARASTSRPGALVRSAVWWRERRFLESPFVRAGASLQRYVLARRGDDVVGYIVFRQRPAWDHGLPAGTIAITELFGIDPRAEATLWQFALQIDLFPNVTWGNAPTDDVLAWMVSNPRQVRRRRSDNLWLRIDDVPAALTARRYAGDGTVRFAFDDMCWELVVDAGSARCALSTRAPDLRMSRATLGALYLGGVSAGRLARADLVHGDPATIAAFDRMFASAIAPWCPEVF